MRKDKALSGIWTTKFLAMMDGSKYMVFRYSRTLKYDVSHYNPEGELLSITPCETRAEVSKLIKGKIREEL